MSFIRRFSICVALLLCCTFFVSAIPGVESKVDFPGTFVYYRDYTYEDETYIGFLQYDAGTYALRYFSPDAKKGAKTIELYITCDTTKDTVEMTGEKIVGEITQIDVETLNYLHDLFYELAKRRKSLTSKFDQTVRSAENYPQFGGEVLINYEPYIPLFGVRSILSNDSKDKKPLFKLAYIGILNEGSEFTNFSGLTVSAEPKQQSFALKKFAKSKKVTLENYSFTLDEQWQKDESQSEIQAWCLNGSGDEPAAMILPYFLSFPSEEKNVIEQLKLVSLLSQSDSCIDFDSLSISENDKRIQISTKINQTDKVIRSITTFYKMTGNDYFAIAFSADEQLFSKNERYFKKIIDSAAQVKAR